MKKVTIGGTETIDIKDINSEDHLVFLVKDGRIRGTLQYIEDGVAFVRNLHGNHSFIGMSRFTDVSSLVRDAINLGYDVMVEDTSE